MGKTRKKKTREKLVGRKRGKGKASALPSFFLFYSRVRAFSIQRTRLTQSLEQATLYHERKGRWIVEQDFHGNFQVNITCFLPFSLASLTDHTHSKTDDITRSRRELDRHGGGGGGGTGGLGGNVETPLNVIYCHQFFLLFFIKMC